MPDRFKVGRRASCWVIISAPFAVWPRRSIFSKLWNRLDGRDPNNVSWGASLTLLARSVNELVGGEDAVRTSECGRKPLTRQSICEAALHIIDAGGLSAISMRGLASELGVKAGSLYHHFKNKEDLLAGVAELLYRRLGPLPGETDWRGQVSAIFLQLAQGVQAHPHAASILIRNLPRSSVARERAEALASAVGDSGLDERGCASLLNNLAALLAGHSVMSDHVGGPVEASESKEPQIGDSLVGLGTRTWLLESEFASGMEALIRGFGAFSSAAAHQEARGALEFDRGSEHVSQ